MSHGRQPFHVHVGDQSNMPAFKYEWIWDKISPNGFGNAKMQPLRQHGGCACVCVRQDPHITRKMINGIRPYMVGGMSKGGTTATGKLIGHYKRLTT